MTSETSKVGKPLPTVSKLVLVVAVVPLAAYVVDRDHYRRAWRGGGDGSS